MSEDKNIIKINRPKITSEVVREKENFEGIVEGHKKLTKRPVYKQKKFYFLLFLILIITFLIYYSEQKAEKNNPIETEHSPTN